MDAFQEVLVVSDSESKNSNCSIYDLKIGGLLATFKEGNSVRHGLSFIANDFLISAFKDEQTLKVWTLSKDQYRDECKMYCKGPVSALAVSPCGTYCAGAIYNKIHVWEVSSGNLLTSLEYHSQDVTCLRFSSDGSHFISGGKDGIVLVWLLAEAVPQSTEAVENLRPRFTWMDHAAEVTDIHVGSLGIYARVVTASRDMTCRIYELETGYLLTTVRVDFAITAVTMDESEYFLVLGSGEGDIYRINLFSIGDPEVRYDATEKKSAFLGHSNEITCLSISATGKYLVSGSDDKACRVWDMTNFSCIRKLPLSGPVTNAFITLLPPGLKSESRFNPRLTVSNFKRDEESTQQPDELELVTQKIQPKNLSLFHVASPNEFFDDQILNCTSESLEAMMRGNLSVEDLSRINMQMYSYALSDIAFDLPTESDSNEDSD